VRIMGENGMGDGGNSNDRWQHVKK
jgi:hypothetical protein